MLSFKQSISNITTQFAYSIITNSKDDNDDQPPLFDPRRQTQTLFKVQLYVCSILGLICFFTFCFLRYKFPILFTVRSYRNKKIKKLPNDMFSWIKILISINNNQLLQVIGLESYVFLCFFRMSIKILLSLSILGICVLSPIRFFTTGSFDNDNSFFNLNYFKSLKGGDDDDDNNNDENSESIIYLTVSTICTYIFTALIYYFLFKETNHIIKTRQKFLGSQRSITDRTIVIKNIPNQMCNELDLKNHIQDLQVGKVEQINFVYDYSLLVELFNKRNKLINNLEIIYSKSCGLDINLFNSLNIQNVHMKILKLSTIPTDDYILYDPNNNNDKIDLNNFNKNTDNNNNNYYVLATSNDKYFNRNRKICFKISKNKKDLIDSNIRELIKINDKIIQIKEKSDFKRLPIAFVTMDSVTDAQMAAQAVFSPKVFELITELAPAPLDVNWNNLLLNNKTVFLRKNIIEFIIIVFSCLLIIPIRYITSLLNVNSIRKMWKEFGDYLIKHDKVRTIVTGLLPTYLFSLINSVLPYVISLLSNLQGLGSKGDVELSVIKKNFLYIFFNLFLVFTLFGTLSSYKALLTDTTKIAPLLATSIKSLSLFYIDLILLQGLTMFPFKLLQIGDLCLFFWNFIINFKNKTPRLFRDYLYKPQIFDLGLILPQHILIFIITILYSSISTKILVSGLVYFILGFYTYKYQLVYSLVHPYHSTGKAWPIIFKRICLGVFFLHLQMFGSLALEQSFVLAGLMLPLFPSTVVALMFFDRNYKPLLYYIALDAIKTRGKSVEFGNENDELNNLLIETGFSQTNNLINNDNNNDNNINNNINNEDDISKGIKRKASVASLENFLDGNSECDAVVLDSLTESSSQDQSNEDVITEFDETEARNMEEGNIEENYQTTEGNMSNTINDSSSIQETPQYKSKLKKCRKHSTIEEERESTQSYIHPCLSNSPIGVMVGFGNDNVDYLNFKLKFDRVDSNQINYGAVQITTTGNNNDNNNENIEHDLEAPKGKVIGYVTRTYPIEEVF